MFEMRESNANNMKLIYISKNGYVQKEKKKTRYAKTNQKGRACSSSSDCKNLNKYIASKNMSLK